MNPIQSLEQRILAELPSCETNMDASDRPGGEWWLDATNEDGHTVTIQWSNKRGFGVTASAFESGYGEGPEETPDSSKVADRVIELLKSGAFTVPPIDVALRELRIMAGLTQETVASRLGVQQSAISRFEGRKDMSLSTLRRYVAAIGGTLRIQVVTAEGTHLEIHSADSE